MSTTFMHPCGGCPQPVDIMLHNTVSITHRLLPLDVTYYHPGCYDPWADYNTGRVSEAIERLESEVRTVSSTGGEKGVKPARFDLVPVGPLTTVAKLYGKGAEKYDDHNWARGYEWSKSYAALMRHVTQFWGGEDVDSDTGLPHMASVVFHALALLEFMEKHRAFDDRPIAKRETRE